VLRADRRCEQYERECQRRANRARADGLATSNEHRPDVGQICQVGLLEVRLRRIPRRQQFAASKQLTSDIRVARFAMIDEAGPVEPDAQHRGAHRGQPQRGEAHGGRLADGLQCDRAPALSVTLRVGYVFFDARVHPSLRAGRTQL
jgi:hypothetical protein